MSISKHIHNFGVSDSFSSYILRLASKLPIFHMLKRLITLGFFTTMLFISCDEGVREADISNIDQQCDFYALNDSLQQFDLANAEEINQQLYQSLGSFWRDYTESILREGAFDDPATLGKIAQFMTDPTISEINTEVSAVLGPGQAERIDQLDKAFRRMRYFFPETPAPQVVFMNSGFNYGIFPTETHLAVGQEWYLGTEHHITQSLDENTFPNYIRKKMAPEFLVGDAMRGWLAVHFQHQYYDDSDLLSTVMYWGKILYLMDVTFPELTDGQKINYTPDEIAWCQANERNLWAAFSQQDILYEKRKFEIYRWVNDGPFTSAQSVPQESPSRLGMWIGWQVIRDYMERNNEVTPEQLLQETNYLKLLNAYRPG